MGLVTYFIDNMRVTKPSGKTAERNPERVFTVNGVFHSTEPDAKGKLVRKDKLTILSKNLDVEHVKAEGFVLDVSKGMLTMPEGERGRKPSASLSQEDILAELAALTANPEPEPEDEPEPESK